MTQEKWESEKGGLCCFSGEDYHDTCGSCYPTAIAPGVVVWREGPLKLSECRGTSYRLAVVFWVLPPLLILITHIYGCRSHSSANLTCSYFFYFPFNVEQIQKKHMRVGCCVQWLSITNVFGVSVLTFDVSCMMVPNIQVRMGQSTPKSRELL